MPDFSLVMFGSDVKYSMTPKQYMFAPFVNETDDSTACVLGLSNATDVGVLIG